VLVSYQTALGVEGNVGADALNRIATAPPFLNQATCWNPFDASNGRAPESVDRIIRRAPEMFRFRQLRAVTLADYVKRAEELPEVSRASAAYAWTGSWRTVRIAIDPKGGTKLDDALRKKLARYLDAVRLIGEDLEIRPPLFVPLEIHVELCVMPEVWPQDLRFVIEQEFSTGYTHDGRLAFFHPDEWTFGQALYASEIFGRLQAIPGVEHVIQVTMKRWNSASPATAELVAVRSNEIILVNSDPDRMEEGFIDFELKGGRQ
jgi:predicted phage baseplate assembly protein